MSKGLAVLFMSAGWLLAEDLPPHAGGAIRVYYIAADEIEWNYAPAEHDHMTGKPYDNVARALVENGPQHIGRIYKKAVYREYTDETFTKPKPRSQNWEHLGIVGPVLRGEAGDTLRVVFRNNAHFPFSMHPHGVRYDGSSDGVKGVPPGETITYTWTLDPRTAPHGNEPSSKLWIYHSHAHEGRDIATGLIGGIIVSAKGTTKTDGTPKDIDREFIALFYTANENQSWYLNENIAKYIKDPASLRTGGTPFPDALGDTINVGFAGSNLRETINGFQFGNSPGFTMKQAQRVRWYTAALGGLHSAHWHANTVTLDERGTDVVPLLPAEMHTVDMVAENPGTWMFHCHVEGHLAIGMYTHYTVQPVDIITRNKH